MMLLFLALLPLFQEILTYKVVMVPTFHYSFYLRDLPIVTFYAVQDDEYSI